MSSPLEGGVPSTINVSILTQMAFGNESASQHVVTTAVHSAHQDI